MVSKRKWPIDEGVTLYEIKQEGGPHIIVKLDRVRTPEELAEVHRSACKRYCEARGVSSCYYEPTEESLKAEMVDGKLPWWVCPLKTGYKVP